MTKISKHSGVSVLVVDDDDATRDVLRMLFEHEGYSVVEARDGETALTQLLTLRRRLVVLLDWALPGLDGVELLHVAATESRRFRPHAFILMTGTGKDESALPPDVAVSLVKKPFDITDLLTRVKDAAAELTYC